MHQNVLLLVLILFIVACEAAAQSCANYLRHYKNIMYLIAGGLFYLLVVFLLSKAHEIAPMGVVNAIWSGLSVITIASVGYFSFGQKLTAEQMTVMGIIACGVAYLAAGFEPHPGGG